jgi:predicted Fe-S protein YdhL (DUF1289 family)|tara:strand:- start:767 stop:916 length:150 start_codon:yes stop_codon:yes gene_type:complete
MILSPCKKVCKLNEDNTHCIICKRTVDQISRWRYYTDEERKKIMEELND